MQKDKKTIMVFVDWFLPGFKAGGPIRSVAGLTEKLSDRYHFLVVTANTDLNDNTPYSGMEYNKWISFLRGVKVMYCSPEYRNYTHFKSLIISEQPDLIYLNSMFSVSFTMLPLMALRQSRAPIPVILAPRGMLSKGALSLKPLKKKLFLWLARQFGLLKHVTFHASSDVEMNEIRAAFGNKVPVFKAANLAPTPVIIKDPKIKQSGSVHLAYLGRISVVKNLEGSLKALKDTDPSYHFTYDIYGMHDDVAYYEKCRSLAASMPSHVSVTFKGGISNTETVKTLARYHFFYMLTGNENFGHAILEALTAGCPVIISDKTPWRSLSNEKAGWDLNPSDNHEVAEVLNRAASMDQETYNVWSEASRLKAQLVHRADDAVRDHQMMFDSAMRVNQVSGKIN